MLGHCINENCRRPLQTFADGRLFQFEIVSISVTANDAVAAPFDERPRKETAHFWLCGNCATTFTLVLDPTHGIKLVSHEEMAEEQRRFLTVAAEQKRRYARHQC